MNDDRRRSEEKQEQEDVFVRGHPLYEREEKYDNQSHQYHRYEGDGSHHLYYEYSPRVQARWSTSPRIEAMLSSNSYSRTIFPMDAPLPRLPPLLPPPLPPPPPPAERIVSSTHMNMSYSHQNSSPDLPYLRAAPLLRPLPALTSTPSILRVFSDGISREESERSDMEDDNTTFHLHSLNQKKKRRARTKTKECLARQRLSRDRQKCAIESLQLDVNALKQQVMDLTTKRQLLQMKLLMNRASVAGSSMKTVFEYFRLFRHGFILAPSSSANTTITTTPCTSSDRISREIQEQYLLATMDEDVPFGPERGVNSFLTQWKRYSSFHEDLFFEQPELHIHGSQQQPIVTCIGNLHARITRRTIDFIYPSVRSNEQLIQQMVGKKIVYPIDMRFYFNEEGKVVKFQGDVDFITALNQVLQDLHQVNSIVEEALVEDSCLIGQTSRRKHPKIYQRISSNSGTITQRRQENF